MDPLEAQLFYEFGEFQLDAKRCVLRWRHGGQPLELTPKALATLLYLVEHAGQVVEKQVLFAAVWPKVVVEEGNLTQTIHVLRRALGEHPDDHRFIVTVPGRGYRFVAHVARVSQPSPSGSPAPASEDQGRRGPASRTGRITILAFACLIGAALIAFAGYALWVARESTQQAAVPSAAPGLPARTVAVLPFENLAGDTETESLALNITEDVLHRLANVPGLTVISRTSSFAFRGKPTDAREIGRALGARYLLEGSVQTSGKRLRVTAQLIDASTGNHVWSRRFEEPIGDMFEVGDQIAHGVARALEVSLSETSPYARYGTDAYLEFVQGKKLIASRKTADAERAIEHFARAIEIAPSFAEAYVALAEAHRHLANLIDDACSSPGMQAVQANALPLLVRALALDDSLGQAYVVRADLKNCSGDAAGAEADFRKGLQLNPGYGAGHERFAEFLADEGRNVEALAEIDQAIIVDPLTPRNYYLKGLFLFGEESIQEAEALFLQALRIAPDFYPALTRLASIRAYYQGLYAEGIKLAERAVAIDPRPAWVLMRPVHFYLEVEDVDAARAFVAAQPESVRPALWLPICLYAGQPERAAEIIRSNPQRWSDGMGIDVEVYVLRDTALARGNLAQARTALPALLKGSQDYTPIARAQLSFALGDRREGAKLAREVLDEEDADLTLRAIAHALLGESQAAIQLLEQEFEHGGRRWWYVFDREPAFEGLRSDARFQELATRVRTRAAGQRRLLEQMRERREVPRRAASTTAGAAPC